jgi:hypothetical protein
MIPHPARLVLASLGFSMAVIVAFVSRWPSVSAAANEPVRVEPSSLAPAKQAAAPLPDSDALIGEILERPLFSPSRQAVEAAPPGEETGQPKEPPKLPRRLAGLSIRPEAREALFERDGEKPVVVKEGQEIDGWVVSLIQPDRVVLNSASDQEIVKPVSAAGIRRPQIQAINRKPGAQPAKNPNPPAGAAILVRPPVPPQPPVQQAPRPAQTNLRSGR